MLWLLVAFGWVYIIFGVAVIAIPFIRRRSDLLTSFNLFMLGAVNFIGIASVRAADPIFGRRYYDDSDMPKFIIGAIVFTIALFIGYYALPRRSRSLGGRFFRKWPPDTDRALAIMCVPLVGASLEILIPLRIQFIGQTVGVLGEVAAYMLVTLALVLWMRKRQSLPRLILLVVITIWVAILSLSVGTSRRELTSLLLIFLIVPYWMSLRYFPSRKYMWKLVVIGSVCFLLVSGYNAIRHRKLGGITLTYGIQSILMLPSETMDFNGTQLESMTDGDAAVECSLAAIHWYTYYAQPVPFFTLRFLVSNPVPRAWWPDKPEALGESLPRDVGQYRYGFVNWGPGIIGHCYQEGGLFFAVFYGLLFGAGLRYFDELLARQSDNPYLLGIFGACSADMVAFTRGDIGLFLTLIVGYMIFGIVISTVARFFLGTELIYPTDNERAEMQMHASYPETQPAAPSAWEAY